MSYALRLIARDVPALKTRIAASDAPPAVQTALMSAIDALTLEDTSPASYVIYVDAIGIAEPHEVNGTFVVRRIEALDEVIVAPAPVIAEPEREVVTAQYNAPSPL